MMTEQAKVPEIRFAGFTDPWEQRKFSEIVDVCSGRDYKQLDGGPIPVYGTGGYMTSVSEALSHNRDAIGIGRKGTIDKPYLLKAPFWTVDTLFYAIPKSDINLEFALCSFSNVDWKSKDESTGLPSLSKESINETVLSVPNVVEQNHLGSFFADLDRLITLHQRKYDKLVVFKKSMLEKMFPKDGESVPEIRFAGFTDPWEQRKLGELSSEFQSGDFISAEEILGSGPYPVYGGNGLRGYAKQYNHDGFYALIGRQGALCGNVNTAVGKAYFTEHAVAVKANFLHDTRFLAHLLGCMDLGRYSGQSAQPGLAVGVLKEVETTVPSKAEQQAIGSFFSRLDSLITLHQRKLELLQNIKKSLLDKMFA
ncbi:MAG: restriction endonuclease subunit S [Bifidobacterium longum]|nr:restriction endonuclease subunit S [Bifidobacterium longum]